MRFAVIAVVTALCLTGCSTTGSDSFWTSPTVVGAGVGGVAGGVTGAAVTGGTGTLTGAAVGTAAGAGAGGLLGYWFGKKETVAPASCAVEYIPAPAKYSPQYAPQPIKSYRAL